MEKKVIIERPYIVLFDSSITGLEKKVAELMIERYVPIGGIQVYHGEFIQAMSILLTN